MSGSLIPNGKQQYFDANGTPLAGGMVYYYIPYTTTAKNTWQDINLSILNTNPIILDAAGECIAWGAGAYRQQVYDVNNNLIWDQYTYGISPTGSNFVSQEEVQTATQGQTAFSLTTITYTPGINSLVVFVNGSKQLVGTNYTETSGTVVTFVTGLNAGDVVDFYASLPATSQNMSNAVTVAYYPPFTNSVATNVQAKLAQTVSVKDFGAVGDGTTDDTTAITTAIANSPLGCDVLFPAAPNGYLISSTINLNRNVRLVFEGARAVNNTGLPGSYLLKKSTMTTSGLNITINGATVYGGGIVGQSGNTDNGITITANNVILDQVCAISCGNDGIRIGQDASGTNSNIFKLINPVCSYNGRHGIYINDNNSGAPNANAGTIITPFCQSNAGNGITVANSWFNTIVGPLCEANTTNGIQFQSGSDSNTVVGGDCEANTVHDILIDSGANFNSFFGTFIGAGISGLVDNGLETVLIGQYVNKIGALTTTPSAGKSITASSAGNSIYFQYASNATGAIAWKVGDGIISPGTYSIYDSTNSVQSLNVTDSGVGLNGYIRPGLPTGGQQAFSGMYAGVGIPSNTNGQNGDFYFRGDGSAGSSVYMKRSGSWVGIV
jgi:hypothetical protein